MLRIILSYTRAVVLRRYVTFRLHKHHIMNDIYIGLARPTKFERVIYHAAWKVEVEPLNRSYSQLTFFISL